MVVIKSLGVLNFGYYGDLSFIQFRVKASHFIENSLLKVFPIVMKELAI